MRSIKEILQSTSDSLFPAELGEANVEINSHGYDGDTALHVLLWRKDIEGALALISAGADVNALGDMSETPLHIAIEQEFSEVISALLAAGADSSIRSEFGTTALEVAAAKGGAIAAMVGATAPNKSSQPTR